MSLISERLLSLVNFDQVRHIRNENFNYFKTQFQEFNQLRIDDNIENGFCYPLLLKKPIDKFKLHENNIFIPSLWMEATKRNNSKEYEIECKLSTEMLPLPIDHRYNLKDLERVSILIKK